MSVLQLQTGHYDPTRSEEVVKKIDHLLIMKLIHNLLKIFEYI